LVATDVSGNRVAARNVELVWRLRRWDCGFQRCEHRDEPLGTRTIDIAAAGSAAETTLTIDPPREGGLIATPRDQRGRPPPTSSSIYLWGGGDVGWRTDDSTHLTLVADKSAYQPGEVAHVLVQAPFRGTALVTTERGSVLGKRLVAFTQAAQTIDIPLGETDLPNVYVSVVLVKGRTGRGDAARPAFKLGLAAVKVVPDRKRLRVAIRSDRPAYRPGEPVQVTMRVTDADGHPVRAEVALAAADEGVLSLVAYRTPDPMAVFYAPWGLGVETSTSYERFAHRIEPGEDDDGGVGDGAPADESAGHVGSEVSPPPFLLPAAAP